MTFALSNQDLKHFVSTAGFEWQWNMGVHNRRNTGKWWHVSAAGWTEYLCRKAGVYCFKELQTTHMSSDGVRHICDCFVFPTEINHYGLVVQWESEPTEELKRINAEEYFPNAPEVITLNYDEFWEHMKLLLTGEKPKELFDELFTLSYVKDKWLTEHQLSSKFNWNAWLEKERSQDREIVEDVGWGVEI
jgi:hypothetical protein